MLLPRLAFTALAAAGAASLAAGVVTLTVAAPADEVGGTATVPGVLVTEPGVLALTGGRLTVDVAGGGEVFAGLARQAEAEAWVGDLPAARVAGLLDETELDTRPAGSPAPELPDPTRSDVWWDAAAGEGRATLVVDDADPGMAVVVVGADAEAALTWQRSARHPAGWPLVLGGGLAALYGAVGLARRNHADPRRRRPPAAPAGRGASRRPAAGPRGGRRTPAPLAAVVAAVAPVAASCSALPAPAEVEAAEPAVAVTGDQAWRVLRETADAVAAGLELDPPTGAEPEAAADGGARPATPDRLTGPALDWVERDVRAPDGSAAPDAATAGLVGLVDAVGRGRPPRVLADGAGAWPRTMTTVLPVEATAGEPPQGQAGEPAAAGVLVTVHVSAGPREPYRLWAAMPLLPGESLPPLPPPDRAAEAVPAPEDDRDPAAAGDATDATDSEESEESEGADEAEPERLAEVVAALPPRFADVVAHGDASRHAPEFAADPVSVAVQERRATLSAATRAADTTAAHDVADPTTGSLGEPVVALLAEDGDALVVTGVDTTLRSAVGDGRPPVTPPAVVPSGTADGQVALGLGVGPVSDLEVRSRAAGVFVVPAERGNIRLVAAAEGVVGVAGSP